MSDAIKRYYLAHHDRIIDKRRNSPFWIRRYAHREIHNQFLKYLTRGQRVLDAGCGEGTLTCLLARHGADATGIDISAPNIAAAQQLCDDAGVQAHFLQGDAEHLPFADRTFDVVISSHVLEHLPDPLQGMREIYRVTRNLALIAMPTCLTPACWALLGGDNYWKIGRRTPWSIPLGLARTVGAFIRGEEGPNEGYAGHDGLPHIWRFPWVMRRQIESVGFRIDVFEPGPIIIPYLAHYVPVMRSIQVQLDTHRFRSLFRNVGFGSMAACRKAS